MAPADPIVPRPVFHPSALSKSNFRISRMAIATVLETTTGASAQRLIFGTLDRITCERTNRPNWIHSIEPAAIPVGYHHFGSWYGNSVRRALATHW